MLRFYVYRYRHAVFMAPSHRRFAGLSVIAGATDTPTTQVVSIMHRSESSTVVRTVATAILKDLLILFLLIVRYYMYM